MKGMIYFYLNNLSNAIEDLNEALEYLQEENIFNIDEKNYLRSYTFNSLALIYKELNQKEKAIEYIVMHNKCNIYDIKNIREHLLYDFPI